VARATWIAVARQVQLGRDSREDAATGSIKN